MSVPAAQRVLVRMNTAQVAIPDWQALYKTTYNAVYIGEVCRTLPQDIVIFRKVWECVHVCERTECVHVCERTVCVCVHVCEATVCVCMCVRGQCVCVHVCEGTVCVSCV